MKVERIFIGREPGDRQIDCESVSVVAGAGIEGDRYFGKDDEPGRNLTLIESEVLEEFLSEGSRPYDLSITHRNLVTRGVRLNELVGREIAIGEVLVRGVELCEPCLGLGRALATGDQSAEDVVRRFAHRGGLRADVLAGGVIARGAPIRVIE